MSVNLSVLVMLVRIVTMILMVTVVDCQPLQVDYSHQSTHRRRLHAAYYSHSDGDDVDDARWLWMSAAAAAAAGLTSLITVFALCTCCLPYRSRRRNDESYIGQIDLEDIRVICNRAVTSPAWSTSMDSGVVVNAGALEKQHGGGGTILNNQRATPAKQSCDYKTAGGGGDNASDAGISDVLVENGRIVLQYRNVHAGVRTTENAAAKLDDPDTVDRTRPGHVISAPVKPKTDLEYDMNDVVWKNMAASCT